MSKQEEIKHDCEQGYELARWCQEAVQPATDAHFALNRYGKMTENKEKIITEFIALMLVEAHTNG